jgi:hypothetical protein
LDLKVSDASEIEQMQEFNDLGAHKRHVQTSMKKKRSYPDTEPNVSHKKQRLNFNYEERKQSTLDRYVVVTSQKTTTSMTSIGMEYDFFLTVSSQ